MVHAKHVQFIKKLRNWEENVDQTNVQILKRLQLMERANNAHHIIELRPMGRGVFSTVVISSKCFLKMESV